MSTLNSLTVEACGHIEIAAGAIVTANDRSWVRGGSATYTPIAAGITPFTTITLDRPILQAEAHVKVTAMSGATYAFMTHVFTSTTTLVIYADDTAGTGAGGGNHVDNISFDFTVERKPGT